MVGAAWLGTCSCSHVPQAPACDASALASMRLPLLPLLVLPLVLARPAAVSILYEDLLQGSRRDHASPTNDLRALLKKILVQDRNCWPKADENNTGICWTGMDRGGRCSSVAALRVGRAECCAGGARAPAAWSPRDLDSGEIFFYKALSGGYPCTACAESCAGVSCGQGRRCVVRGGRARCVCAAACRRVGAVCGSDGKTYTSLCRLRRRACRRPAKHLVLDYPGPCQEGTCSGVRCGGDKRCVLDAELGPHCVRCGGCAAAGAPLCAVDGRTYMGACALRRAACERGRALPLAYKGPCVANATCATITCGAGQRCVSGGASGARCVSCGPCSGSRRQLCGSDARTYGSWCRLQRAVCHGQRLVETVHSGPCKNKTITDNSVTDARSVSGVGKRVL